jgi:hypothetical protein
MDDDDGECVMTTIFKRGGKEYWFDLLDTSPDTGFVPYRVYLTGTINWGLAPSHRITQRGPFQNGDTDIDFRLDPRIISLPFVAPATSFTESFNVRAKILQVFKPGNDTAQLTFSTNSFARQIDVQVVGGLTMDTDARDFTVRGVIQLRAADPTWYDLYETTRYLSGTLFGTPTPYPKPYPVPYGAGTINNISTINYLGSWASYPRIQCEGPATDLTIVDGLGNIIQFDDAIPAGQIWTIDLSYGKKSVVDQNGVNKFAALNINSNLVDWGLYPDPTILNGTNTISVSASGTDTNSEVIMYYAARYIGV